MLHLSQDAGCVRFTGAWTIDRSPPIDHLARQVQAQLHAGKSVLQVDVSEVDRWDTCLPMAVCRLIEDLESRGGTLQLDGLPSEVANLVRLAREVPEQVAQGPKKPSLVDRAGAAAMALWESTLQAIAFCGDLVLALLRTLRAPWSFRWRTFWILLGDCGFRALPIVGMIAFLTGLILAFVGAIQLRMFGADLYVADLVGLAMSREMAALMTSMIMSGRSGAAFAAHLGTMKVSEEIDALTTFGFHPVDMLALPRVLALVLMMPLLCLYSNLLGYFGGAFIGWSMLDISYTQYLFETQTIVTTKDISIGLVKSAVFGFIIAAAGCLQGLKCGHDASAVGLAATRAVVTSITLIVIADAVFAVICEVLKI